MTTETSTAISRQRRPRGRYPKTQDGATPKRQKRIPEYLEPDEVNAIIRSAPNPKAKLLMLERWRAGLRVSEALDLEVLRPVPRYGHSHTQGAFRKGRQDSACAGASGSARRSEQRTRLRGHQPRQNRRGSSRDGVALGTDSGETCRGAGCDCAGEAGWNAHAASQLCPAPADEQHPHQLPIAVGWVTRQFRRHLSTWSLCLTRRGV